MMKYCLSPKEIPRAEQYSYNIVPREYPYGLCSINHCYEWNNVQSVYMFIFLGQIQYRWMKRYTFGQICRHMHTDSLCSIHNCKKKSCLGRDSRPCKFFPFSGFCKFGADCSLIHPHPVASPLQSDIVDLKVST